MEQQDAQQPGLPAPLPPPKHPMELLKDAQNKVRLTSVDRRRVIAYIAEYGYKENGKYKDLSNVEMAELFQVDEAVIRRDKKKIAKEQSGTLSPEESMEFVHEFLQEHNALIRRAKEGLNQAPGGTLNHVRYIQTISVLAQQKIKILQETGILPKELGHLGVTQEDWRAYVLEDGVTGVEKITPALPPKADDEFEEAVILGEDQQRA